MSAILESENVLTQIPPLDEIQEGEVFYLSEEEYLELVEKHEGRFQYENGKVTLMPYAQKNHNIVEANTIIQLGIALEESPLIVSTNETLIYVPAFDLYANPDVVVFQEPTEYRERRKGIQALLNPVCLIEILSPSTAHYDRSKKLQMYQSIPTLQQYVMISQEEIQVETLTKNKEGEWVYRFAFEADQSISILDHPIPLSKLYAKVQFEKADIPAKTQ